MNQVSQLNWVYEDLEKEVGLLDLSIWIDREGSKFILNNILKGIFISMPITTFCSSKRSMEINDSWYFK